MTTLLKWLIIISFLFGLLGCNKQIKIPLKPVDNRNLWKVLAPFIKKHFDTGDMTVREIAAELSYQEYLMNKDKG